MTTSYSISGDLHFLGFDIPVFLFIDASSSDEAIKRYTEIFKEFRRLKQVKTYLESIPVIREYPPESDSAALICVRNVKCMSSEDQIINRPRHTPPIIAKVTDDQNKNKDFKPTKYDTISKNKFRFFDSPVQDVPDVQPRSYKIKIVNHEPVRIEEF
jgi:hypothetical protein